MHILLPRRYFLQRGSFLLFYQQLLILQTKINT